MPGYLLDLDGVVYRGNQLIDGSLEKIAELRAKGHGLVFVTNNGTKSREGFCQKLQRLGIPAQLGDIVNTAYAAAQYIKDHYGPSSVYVIGEEGLRDELRVAGHRVLEDPQEPGEFSPKVVLVSLDRGINYRRLSNAMTAILSGAVFVATNTDATFPAENGGLQPGAGSVVAAVTTAVGTDPIVIGKPYAPIMDIAYRIIGLPPDQCVMIGDRLNTDIAAGKATGARTVLVLTGVTAPEELEHCTAESTPDLILDRLGDLEVE